MHVKFELQNPDEFYRYFLSLAKQRFSKIFPKKVGIFDNFIKCVSCLKVLFLIMSALKKFDPDFKILPSYHSIKALERLLGWI